LLLAVDLPDWLRRSGAVRLILIMVALTGCSDNSSASTVRPSPSTYTASATVIQPGRPGEPATRLTPGQVGERPPEPTWNGSDLLFVTMMVQHHTQALRLAELAQTQAVDQRVRAVAERVSAAQAPEIASLRAWLAARGQKPTKGAHTGHGMPGEVTALQIEALARTGGSAFDRRFLDLLVRHHRGAVQMAGEVGVAGTDPTVQDIAADVFASQSAEIRRMKQIRSTL
jgi:uncharacterized protein (DUF305 family)